MGKPKVNKRAINSSRGTLTFWRGKGAVLLVGLVLWLVLVLAYAGPMAASAVYRLIYDGGVLLLWLAASIGIGLILLKPFFPSDASAPSRLLKYVTAAGLGLGCISLMTLGLGLLGVLNQIVAIAIVAVGVMALIATLLRSRSEIAAFSRWCAEPTGWDGWLFLLAVPVAAMMTVAAMLPPYLLWGPREPHGYDAVEYHLQVPREWYEAGRIIPLHHNVFSFLPFNVEMHYLLAMHLRGGPWAGMYLAQFMHGVFVVLSVIAVAAVIGRLSKAPGAALVATLAAAGAPMLPQLGSIAYVEGGFLFFGALSIGWTLIALREEDDRVHRFALAGIMAGLACGAKLTALPEVLVAAPAVVIVLLLLWPQMRAISFRKAIAPLAAFGFCGLIAFAPWLARTQKWAGNPLFPEVLQLGHGHFSEAQVERWRRSLEPRADQRSVTGRLEAGWKQVAGNWQYGFLLIPAAIAAIALNRRDPNVHFLGAMFVLLSAFWLGFTHLQARFFVLAVPICAMLIATMPRTLAPVVIVQALIGMIALHMNMTSSERPPWNQLVQLLGDEVLMPRAEWMTPQVVRDIPEGASIALVGDARAFLYQVPMARLTYRTVFDVDAVDGKSLVEAYAGPPANRQWLVIDPLELERFARTYQPFPKVPADIAAHNEVFVVRR